MEQIKFRFPGLSGLRFLAAFGVVLHHVEQVKWFYGIDPLMDKDPAYYLGYHSVLFFFALSGFLITYLLLLERSRFSRVDVKQFYIRRVLRIWPLYFVIVLLGLVVLPRIPIFAVPGLPTALDQFFWPRLFWYCVMSAHVAIVLYPTVAYATALWSVGVEEWFYAFWPWLFRFSTRTMICVCGVLIIAFGYNRTLGLEGKIGGILSYTRFDCMAIGALAAIILFESKTQSWAKKILAVLHSRAVQILAWVSLLASVWFGMDYGRVDHGAYSLMFTLVMINLASNPRSLVRMDGKVYDWLGDISYGLYCYNWPVIVFVTALVRKLQIQFFTQNVLLYLGSMALLVFVARTSYVLIERPFLRLKRKSFSPIVT